MSATRSIIAAALVACATAAGAQVAESGMARQPPARQQRGARQEFGRGTPNDRQALERRVRQAFAGVVRRQLNLDAAQMQNLQRVDQKFEQQRRVVLRDERDARQNLRAAMQDSTGHADQDKIAQYLDQIVLGQRRRADLLEQEQKELSNFLTPLQRAQYFALKERITRKLLDLQADSSAGRGGRRGFAPPDR
ncbi:MAG TPA: hypothetical protein VKP00_11825 [Gemmatimonadaceae bacterium]|nr:hypothetical protein [Gemmatimonadaceae bacterium]